MNQTRAREISESTALACSGGASLMYWYAVQSKAHQESLAAASVAELDLETVLPRALDERYVGGVLRRVRRAFFPGYFFARFCPIRSAASIRCCRGVIRLVGSSQAPIPLDEQIISEIRGRMEPDGVIPLVGSELHLGDQVVIEHGPFEGLVGRVEREPDGERRVSILLDAINEARVLVDKRWVSVSVAVG